MVAQSFVVSPALISLAVCRAGSRVRVERIDSHDDDGCRLRELGLYEGAEVEVISHGDPVVMCLLNNRFAVCNRCAREVHVVVLEPPAAVAARRPATRR